MNNDSNVRIIIVHKDCYSKYCSKCSYCVKAEWSKNEGFKYHVLDVQCCMEGGKKGVMPVCPNGVAWHVCLGETQTFNPNEFLIPYPLLISKPELNGEIINGNFQ